MRRQLICVLLVLAMLCSFGFVVAQTEDDDSASDLDSDTTWTQGSGHTLDSNLIIPAGVTLTIEPGVNVDLREYQIQVYGALNALGTSENRVVFTTSYALGGLYANMPSPDRLYFALGSSGKIEHAYITNKMYIKGSINVTDSSLQGYIEVESGASVFMQNDIAKIHIFDGTAMLVNNNINGLMLIGGSPTLTNNIINGWTMVHGGSPTLTGNTINGRIDVGRISGEIVFSQNKFFAPISVVSIDYLETKSNWSAGSSSVTLKDNLFTVSYDPIITVRGGFRVVNIVNNEIIGNGKAQTAINAKGDESANATALNAVLTGNRISNCKTGIDIQHANAEITQNLIVNNTLGIKINSAYNNPQENAVVDIHKNTFANNSVGIEIVSCDYQTPLNITNNEIYGNTEYNLKLSSRDNRKFDFAVPYNWWGTTDVDAISKSIYDADEDPRLGIVTFTPFIGNASGNESASAPIFNPMLIIASLVAIFCVATVVVVFRRLRRTSE
ncbi:MAG: hypothetical protein NWE92_01385 [Candidatus Bathyarchaeota archaeon]|nr:hypothetical protein [Candidatus Bathyarchaeota archaeon]